MLFHTSVGKYVNKLFFGYFIVGIKVAQHLYNFPFPHPLTDRLTSKLTLGCHVIGILEYVAHLKVQQTSEHLMYVKALHLLPSQNPSFSLAM